MRSLVLISTLVVVTLAALGSAQSLDSPSCEGWCGFFSSDRFCQCNPGCEVFGDCCTDFATVCADLAAAASTEAPTDIEFVDDGQLGSHFDGGIDGTVVDEYADASSGDSSSSSSESSSVAPTDSEEPFSDEYADSSAAASSSEAASTESTAVVTDSEEPFSDDGKQGSNFDGGIDSVVSDEYADSQSGSGDGVTETEAASTVSGVVVTDSDEPFSDDGKVGSNFDGGVDSHVVDEYSDAPSADTTQAATAVEEEPQVGQGQGQAAADDSATSTSSSTSSTTSPATVAGVIGGVALVVLVVALVANNYRSKINARNKASLEAVSALNSVIATTESRVTSV